MFIEPGRAKTLKLRRSEKFGFNAESHCAPLELKSLFCNMTYKHFAAPRLSQDLRLDINDAGTKLRTH